LSVPFQFCDYKPPSCEQKSQESIPIVYAIQTLQCTFAKWEPIHGKFRFRHPWGQYQKLGALCRQCASSMEALASCVVVLKKSQVIAKYIPSFMIEIEVHGTDYFLDLFIFFLT